MKPAGWHVLIGDNGSGKSSIIRSIAAALIGPEQIAAVLPNWEEWLSKSANSGSIKLELLPDWNVDKIGRGQPAKNKSITNRLDFKRTEKGVQMQSNALARPMPPTNYNWGNNGGWFSVAYGPFRRFTGGDNRWSKVYYASPKAGAHLSVFGEDVALTEALDWLKELDRKRLKEKEDFAAGAALNEPSGPYQSKSDLLFRNLKAFINRSGLLPHNSFFDRVDVDGNILFVDGKGDAVKVTDMSDGYRSILSMTFELIRQMVLTYGTEKVFVNNGETDSIRF
jgi:energy-coupling factor transporter ATP-binding protein EcfA2